MEYDGDRVMTFGCLMPSRFNMTADLYDESVTQDSTGQVKRTWVYLKTIKVEARALGNLRGKQSGTEEAWRAQFINYDYLRLKTADLVTQGNRITNVKDSNGTVLWHEYDQESNVIGNTIFGVLGVSATIDPFGKFLAWDVFCNRVSVQANA